MDEILAHISAPVTNNNDELYRAQAATYFDFESKHRLVLSASTTVDVRSNLHHGSREPNGKPLVHVADIASAPGSSLHRLAAIESRWRSSAALKSSTEPNPEARYGPVAMEASTAHHFADDTQEAILRVESQLIPIQFGDRDQSSSAESMNAEDLLLTNKSQEAHSPAKSPDQIMENISSQLPLSFGLSQTSQYSLLQSTRSEHSTMEEQGRNISQRSLSFDVPLQVSNTDTQMLRTALSPGHVELTVTAKDLCGSEIGLTTFQRGGQPSKDGNKPPSLPSGTLCQPSSRTNSRHQPLSQRQASKNQSPSVAVASSARSPRLKSKDDIDFSKVPIRLQAELEDVVNEKDRTWPPKPSPYLQSLMRNSDLAAAYRPSWVRESIHMTAWRGYWAFETSAWPLATQKVFWDGMTESIKAGKLPGTLIRRGRTTIEDLVVEVPGDELGNVDVWCWAAHAEHYYRMMYVLSSSMIKRTRVRWYNGGHLLCIDVSPR